VHGYWGLGQPRWNAEPTPDRRESDRLCPDDPHAVTGLARAGQPVQKRIERQTIRLELTKLTADERRELIAHRGQMAASAEPGPYRDALTDLPGALGLVGLE
jgi:hypothetical protein